MPTNSEKIDELIRQVTYLSGRVDRAERDLEEVWAAVERLRAADADTQRRLALLEREQADWKRTGEEWGRRGWTILLSVVSLIVGAVATYLLKR